MKVACSLEFSPTGVRFLENGLAVLGCYTAFSNNRKMVTILHKELERKVEKLKHMELAVCYCLRSSTRQQPDKRLISLKYLILA